jgi:hypothetical protein
MAIINKQKYLFFKTKSENRKADQVLSGGLIPVGDGRMWGKDEYGSKTVYTCI